jgi:hypothetical protein
MSRVTARRQERNARWTGALSLRDRHRPRRHARQSSPPVTRPFAHTQGFRCRAWTLEDLSATAPDQRPRNLCRSTTTRSISPQATTSPDSSTAFTWKVRSRPTIGDGSARISTTPPTWVARRCSMRTAVPTVVWPGPVNGAAAITVAASNHAISRGVASTGTSPLPTHSAVSASVT